MTELYFQGEDYLEEDARYTTYGIHRRTTDMEVDRKVHFNVIEVYGDEELRSKIIGLLNTEERE